MRGRTIRRLARRDVSVIRDPSSFPFSFSIPVLRGRDRAGSPNGDKSTPPPSGKTCFRAFLISALAFSSPHHSEEQFFQVTSLEGNISSFQTHPHPYFKKGRGWKKYLETTEGAW